MKDIKSVEWNYESYDSSGCPIDGMITVIFVDGQTKKFPLSMSTEIQKKLEEQQSRMKK